MIDPRSRQLPGEKVRVFLTQEAEYNLKIARCNERREAAAKWFAKWQAIVSKVEKREVA